MSSKEKETCYNASTADWSLVIHSLQSFRYIVNIIHLFDCNWTYLQAEVIVDGSIVRSGRNLTVIAQEFKLKKTGKLIYTARATFYHMPVSKLWIWIFNNFLFGFPHFVVCTSMALSSTHMVYCCHWLNRLCHYGKYV